MADIKILNFALESAQGNLQQSIKAIKEEEISISSKTVSMQDQEMKIPYFLLQNSVDDKFDAIYEMMKSVVLESTKGLNSQQKKSTALLLGTSLIDHNLVEAVESTIYEHKKTPYYSKKRSIDSFGKDLADELCLNPFTMSISTACTSSINALLEAKNLIESGVFEYVVVVGLEVSSFMMSSGFSSMKLLSSSSQKPFDKQRDGLVLGEAIAAVLIGKGESPWSIEGGYSNCNSVNITSVSPSGEEYVEVMQKAMEVSGITSKEITALKAHATSTPTNDLSEINAIAKLFDTELIFTALKPYTGHTLGACGALEVALFLGCLEEGFIPKTVGHTESIIPEYKPLLEHKEFTGDGVFMLNYFGFGGNNTSVLIKRSCQ